MLPLWEDVLKVRYPVPATSAEFTPPGYGPGDTMCVYISMYIYMYIHMYMCIYIYVYMNIHMYMYIYVLMIQLYP